MKRSEANSSIGQLNYTVIEFNTVYFIYTIAVLPDCRVCTE
jgi:hypothetical protein